MNILDDIRADWRSEDARERVSRTAGRAIGGQDRDCWSGSHFVVGCRDVVVGFKNGQLEISSVSRESRKWVATLEALALSDVAEEGKVFVWGCLEC